MSYCNVCGLVYEGEEGRQSHVITCGTKGDIDPPSQCGNYSCRKPIPADQKFCCDQCRVITEAEGMGLDIFWGNSAIQEAVKKLNRILDEGEHHGTFGAPYLEEFAQRILGLLKNQKCDYTVTGEEVRK